jgi:hypothetical protein
LQNDQEQNQTLEVPDLAVEEEPDLDLVGLLEGVEEASRFNVVIHYLLLFLEDLSEQLELHDLLVVVLDGTPEALVLRNELFAVLIDVVFQLFPELILD